MAQKGKKVIKGGARRGAGRKPVDDPKVMIPLYVQTSVINKLGGFEEVREMCYEFLKAKAEKEG